jgi:hypothetical protein
MLGVLIGIVDLEIMDFGCFILKSKPKSLYITKITQYNPILSNEALT